MDFIRVYFLRKVVTLTKTVLALTINGFLYFFDSLFQKNLYNSNLIITFGTASCPGCFRHPDILLFEVRNCIPNPWTQFHSNFVPS